MRRSTLLLVLISALPGCFGSCPTAADARAKARIFSPQEPPKAEREAKKALDAGALASDAKVRHDILRMPAAEMRYRLGSYVAVTRTSFTWTHGDDQVALKETATLDQARGGDFRTSVDNDHDFGMELRWVNRIAYVKNRHGKFLERRSDEAEYEKWRQAALAQLPVWLRLIHDRLALAKVGTGTEDGRPVVRYAVALAPKADPAVAPPPKPPWARPPVYPKGGPDETLVHREAVWKRGKPEMASGEILGRPEHRRGHPLRPPGRDRRAPGEGQRRRRDAPLREHPEPHRHRRAPPHRRPRAPAPRGPAQGDHRSHGLVAALRRRGGQEGRGAPRRRHPRRRGPAGQRPVGGGPARHGTSVHPGPVDFLPRIGILS